MELARDPDALFGDSCPRLLLPLALEVEGEPLEHPLALAPVPHRPTGQPGASENQRDEDEIPERELRRHVRGNHRSDPRYAEPRAHALGVRSDRVDGDAERDGRRSCGVEHGGEVRHHRRGDRDREDGERSPPPPRKREREDEAGHGSDCPFARREDVGSEIARRVRGIDRPHLDLEEHGETESERPVAVKPDEPRKRHVG